MENITRISDLPDPTSSNAFNPNMMSMQPNNSSHLTGPATGYVPINVHPNPYGISTQNPIMPPPQQQQPAQQQLVQQQQQYISEEQLMQMQQRLPSRDIPRDTTGYIQDEQVNPDYLPNSKKEHDYVRRHEDMTEKNLREYEEKNKKERKLDMLLTEFQTPLFVMILFFFFQLPIVNSMLFKRFSFLSIYNDDGNFNVTGLILKSLLFGSSYYISQKVTTFLSEL
jgi:hypothetical protein